jgi:hypothetical protein
VGIDFCVLGGGSFEKLIRLLENNMIIMQRDELLLHFYLCNNTALYGQPLAPRPTLDGL